MLIAETVGTETIYVVEGPSLSTPEEIVKYGIRKADLGRYIQQKQLALYAQFLTLVNDGLVLSKHCFQGLRRNLYCDDSESGDKDKYVFSRKPGYDYIWEGDKNGKPKQLIAPTESVFLFFVSKNGR